MKRPGTFLLFGLVAFLTCSTEGAIHRNKAIVRSVRDGSADISQDDGRSWKRARVGMVLGERGMIRTDNTATVDLFLGVNGPVVRVTKSTTLGIDKLDYENTGIETLIETQLDLSAGRILGIVKKMAASSKYEVKTPNGVAGVRGTEFAISADGSAQVFSGTLIIVYIVDGLPVPPTILRANQQISIPHNGIPTVTVIAPDDPIRREFERFVAAYLDEKLITVDYSDEKPFPENDPAVQGLFDITRVSLTEFVPPGPGDSVTQ